LHFINYIVSLQVSVHSHTYYNYLKFRILTNMDNEMTDRQNEILNASLQLIADKGIQGFTIKNLAKKMNFTESAVYRHFETKIQILATILDIFKNKSKLFLDTESEKNVSAIVKIENLFMVHFKVFTATPSLVAVIFSEELFRNETVLSNVVNNIMTNYAQTLTKIIELGQKKGEIRDDVDATYLTTILMGSIRMMAKQWYMTNYAFDLIVKGTELLNSMKVMVKA